MYTEKSNNNSTHMRNAAHYMRILHAVPRSDICGCFSLLPKPYRKRCMDDEP
jgi:hypothetical protein